MTKKCPKCNTTWTGRRGIPRADCPTCGTPGVTEQPPLSVGSVDWVNEVFTYHAPNDAQKAAYARIRSAAAALALAIRADCPASADRTAALRQVREAVMTANASIALRGLV